MIRLKLLYLFLTLFTLNVSFAQISVQDLNNPAYSLSSLASSAIVGPGVSISNLVYAGDSGSIGYFNQGMAAVGMQNGLVMSTGYVNSINTANNISGNTSTNTIGSSDADIASITGMATFDASVLEFDFVSQGDTIELEMVFASEEYPEFTCAGFNDAFGFFVNGHNISGTYSNNSTNVALIPNSTTPISINTINNSTMGGPGCITTNSNLYVDNPNVTTGNSTYPIIFDGFTTVLNVKFAVTPDSIYHIKLAIADIGDQVFDSAIFLKAKSFSSNSFNPTFAYTSSLGDSTISEQCGEVRLNINYPKVVSQKDTLEFIASGTATMGVDYLNIPSSIVVNEGQDSIQLPIQIINDGIVEGDETLHLVVKLNGVIYDDFSFIIKDGVSPYQMLQGDTSICANEPVALSGSIAEIPTYSQTFNNSTVVNIPDNLPSGATTSINVTNIPENASLHGVCMTINHPWSEDLDVYLVAPNGQAIELTTDNGTGTYTNTCFTRTATTPIIQGTSPFTGDFIPEESWSVLNDAPSNGVWKLIAIDDNIFFTGSIQNFSLEFTKPTNTSYAWQPASSLSCTNCNTTIATPSATTTYTLATTTNFGCQIVDSVTVTVLPTPVLTNLNCTNVTDSTINFAWTDDGTVANTFVSEDGGNSWIPYIGGTTSHLMTNLQANTSYTFQVKGDNQNCESQPLNLTCATSNCASFVATATTDDALGNINLTISGGTTPYSYQWNTGDTTQNLTNLSAGLYTVTITDALGCSINNEVTICGILNANFTVTADSTNTGVGAVDLNITGGISPYSFLWNTGDTTSTLSNIIEGTYTVMITDALGCQDSATVYVPGDALSSSEIDLVEVFTISPNPTSHFTQVQLDLTEHLPVQLIVRDATGKVLEIIEQDKNTEHQITLDFSKYSNGIYLLQFNINGSIITKRIIVQK